MRLVAVGAGAIAGLLGMLTLWAGEPPPGKPGNQSTPGAVAVVELFTSQGCSSCPPADALASTLSAEARLPDRKQNLLVLAFHVDYWDDLGWPDRFATRAFSDRQRDYARHARNLKDQAKGVYTPQMIVNGAARFVGSDGERARQEIGGALKTPAAATLSATIAERKPGEPVHADVVLSGLSDGVVLNGAIVEDGLSTAIERGENRGRTLKHDRVVRAFTTVRPDAGRATLDLTLPKGLDASKSSLVLYVQIAEDMRVVGAREYALGAQSPPPAAAPRAK